MRTLHTVVDRLPLVGIASLVLMPGCFSTLEPDSPATTSSPPTTIPGDQAWVRGKVLLFRAAGERVGMPHTAVSIEWRDTHGNQVDEDVVYTGPGGYFESASSDPRIAQVELATVRCDYDPQNPDARSPWDESVTIRVVPGVSVQQTLVISCASAVGAFATGTVSPGAR